jgi:hypothetical protein
LRREPANAWKRCIEIAADLVEDVGAAALLLLPVRNVAADLSVQDDQRTIRVGHCALSRTLCKTRPNSPGRKGGWSAERFAHNGLIALQ